MKNYKSSLRMKLKVFQFEYYVYLYCLHTHTHSGPAVWYGGQMQPETGLFTQYLYFLFSPTLLYRDNYPRCVCEG